VYHDALSQKNKNSKTTITAAGMLSLSLPTNHHQHHYQQQQQKKKKKGMEQFTRGFQVRRIVKSKEFVNVSEEHLGAAYLTACLVSCFNDPQSGSSFFPQNTGPIKHDLRPSVKSRFFSKQSTIDYTGCAGRP